MFKKIILTVFLVLVTLATRQQMSGAYSNVDTEQLQNLKADAEFIKIESFARQNLFNKYHKQGRLINLSQQVVAGLNYKMTFQTANGQLFEVIVFWQSWTNTIQLTSIQEVTEML